MSKRPIGMYVRIDSELVAVTGAQQSAAASKRLPPNTRRPIDRWTGTEWVSTGLVLCSSDLCKAVEA